MLKKAWKWLPAVVVVLSLLNACQNENTRIHPKIGEGTKTSPASVTPQPQILPTETFTPTPQLLISFDPFASESPLCQAEPDGSYLVLQCEANELSVTQSPDRRRMDIMLRREIPVQAEAVSLDIEVASIPADSVIHDQNQYGLYIVDDAGVYHALRIRGQQFINEIWSTEEEIKVETQTEPVFLSSIKTAEQINHFRWECGGGICDFYNNGDFSARIRLPDAHSIQAVGLFAASDWDETLGEVKFINFSAEIPEKISISSQPFVLTDDLTVDTGIFTQAGLSGAYDIFSDQGFHFSPIIPFETYAVQGGPALVDFSVSARLRMNMDPERKASKFAGIMCRSSAVGSYAAVLRAMACILYTAAHLPARLAC